MGFWNTVGRVASGAATGGLSEGYFLTRPEKNKFKAEGYEYDDTPFNTEAPEHTKNRALYDALAAQAQQRKGPTVRGPQGQLPVQNASWSGPGGVREEQVDLANVLKARPVGQLATMQYNEAKGALKADQTRMARSAVGINPALAQKMAAENVAMGTAQLQGQRDQATLQDAEMKQTALANLYQTTRAGDSVESGQIAEVDMYNAGQANDMAGLIEELKMKASLGDAEARLKLIQLNDDRSQFLTNTGEERDINLLSSLQDYERLKGSQYMDVQSLNAGVAGGNVAAANAHKNTMISGALGAASAAIGSGG